MSAGGIETLSSSSVPVPRAVRGDVHVVQSLERSTADDLLASRQKGDALVRRSLSALYALAADLHSAQLPYPTKQLRTDAKEHVSTEQIWGQMNMLLRPVLRRLHDRVRLAERTHRTAPSSQPRHTTPTEPKLSHDSDEPVPPTSAHDRRRDAALAAASEDDESELDAEIATLLQARQGRRAAKKRAHTASTTTKGGERRIGALPLAKAMPKMRIGAMRPTTRHAPTAMVTRTARTALTKPPQRMRMRRMRCV